MRKFFDIMFEDRDNSTGGRTKGRDWDDGDETGGAEFSTRYSNVVMLLATAVVVGLVQ